MSGDDRCRGAIVRRNYCHDLNTRSQFGGESTFVYSNIFEYTNETAVEARAQAMSVSINDASGNVSIAKELVIANNTIRGGDTGLLLTTVVGDSALLQHNRFANNLVTDWRTFVCFWRSNTVVNTAMMSDSTPQELASWTFANNGFWKSSTDSVILAMTPAGNTIDQYTATLVNTRSGCSGNKTADPLFASGDSTLKFALTSSSPFVSAGVSLASLLPSGMPPVDYNGRAFGLAASVGAVQYPFVGLDSVGISGGPGASAKLNAVMNLSAALHPSNADISSYAWLVRRDGSTVKTGTQSTLAETLATAGNYVVSLDVVDKLGYTRSATNLSVLAFRDSTAPDGVSDLAIDVGKLNAAVSWTAPGDDGAVGTAAEYDLRYSAAPINSGNFASAPRIDTPSPSLSGSSECVLQYGLSSCTTYYVALKSRDAAGNWSSISNVPNAKTYCSGNLEATCGTGTRRTPGSEPALPMSIELRTPWPNPVREVAHVDFGIPAASGGEMLDLAVFDLSGRRISTLAHGEASPGRYSIEWVDFARARTRARPGIYFVRLAVGPRIVTRLVSVAH